MASRNLPVSGNVCSQAAIPAVAGPTAWLVFSVEEEARRRTEARHLAKGREAAKQGIEMDRGLKKRIIFSSLVLHRFVMLLLYGASVRALRRSSQMILSRSANVPLGNRKLQIASPLKEVVMVTEISPLRNGLGNNDAVSTVAMIQI
jgi:hypothetical protein